MHVLVIMKSAIKILVFSFVIVISIKANGCSCLGDVTSHDIFGNVRHCHEVGFLRLDSVRMVFDTLPNGYVNYFNYNYYTVIKNVNIKGKSMSDTLIIGRGNSCDDQISQYGDTVLYLMSISSDWNGNLYRAPVFKGYCSGNYWCGKVTEIVKNGKVNGYTMNEAIEIIEGVLLSTEKKLDAHTDLEIYPNPVTSTLTIEFQTPIEKVLIRSLEGRLIKEVLDPELTTTIDISHYPKGMYFVEIQEANHSRIEKVLVE